jgi:hypothetical protein
MAISSMFRRALSLIPSPVTSTANYGFTRVLSFTGSFNDRTNLLLATAPEPVPVPELDPVHIPPPLQSQEAPPAPPVMTGATLDIEAATLETPPAGGDSSEGGQEQGPIARDAEAKRMAKMVQTVCLFVASASLVLFVNLPSKPGVTETANHGCAVLYSVDMAIICLGLFTSLGLSMFSIVKSGTDPAVARVQKRAMVMAVAFVLVSFTLRMCMMLPAASLESAWLIFVLLAGAVMVYLALTWKFGGRGGAEVASSSGFSASSTDRV